MDKYRIVGVINIFVGIAQFLVQIIMALTLIPRLNTFYSEMGLGQNRPTIGSSSIVLGIAFVVFTINLFLGWGLIKGNINTKKNYFIYGIVALIVTFVLLGIIQGILTTTILSPINNLYSQP